MRHTKMTQAKVVREKTAAAYIGMSVPFLRQSRMEGNRQGRTPGPPFIKIGRSVRYHISDLDSWLDSHRIEPSSPEPA